MAETYAVQSIDKFYELLQKVKLSWINDKIFRIGKWTKGSQLFMDIFIFGLILFILSVFHIISYVIVWIYVLIGIFLLGFIFSRPDKTYNYTFVIFIFVAIAFIPTRSFQIMLLSTETSFTNPYDKDTDYGHWSGWEVGYISPPETSRNPYAYGEALDYWEGWNAGHKAKLDEVALGNSAEYKDYDMTHLLPLLNDLVKNPLDDITLYLQTLFDVINWIVFLFMIGFGASAIGDVISFQWEKVAEKVAVITLAIVIMVFIYSVFGAVSIPTRTIADTLGSAWNDFLGSLGLVQLDFAGNTYSSPLTIVNGMYKWFPLIFLISCFTFALYYRKKDLKSIMFAKYITKDTAIEIAPTTFTPTILILLLVIGVYIAGYMLYTANPIVQIDPLITLTFFIIALIFIFLLGLKVLIVNRTTGFYDTIKNIGIYFVVGSIILFAWFQVLQPAFYFMNLTDTATSLIPLSQGVSEYNILTSSYLEQTFLVAFPETTIFQIGFIGIGNRIYWQLRKGKLIEKRKEKLQTKLTSLRLRKGLIPLTDSISKANIKNLAKIVIMEREIDKIMLEIESKSIRKSNYSYFIIPSLIFGLIGSFFFADFHRFRRNIGFADFWQNANLGLTYFGAGFVLSIISIFSWFGAILVHAVNNILSLIIVGAIV